MPRTYLINHERQPENVRSKSILRVNREKIGTIVLFREANASHNEPVSIFNRQVKMFALRLQQILSELFKTILLSAVKDAAASISLRFSSLLFIKRVVFSQNVVRTLLYLECIQCTLNYYLEIYFLTHKSFSKRKNISE